MSIDSKEDMERIHKNLEQFLTEDLKEDETDYKEFQDITNIKTQKNKKSKGKFIVFFFLCVFILGGVAFSYVFNRVYKKMEIVPIEQYEKSSLNEDGVINILLIGSDSRTQEKEGRSDAMILLSVSKKTKSIQMVSLLRDMYVEISGHDGNRLNASYSFGGPELLLKTVSQNLGIHVSHYIVVNFQAFANLVDAVGGVSLEVTNEEVQWINAYLNEYNLLRGMSIDTDYLEESLSGNIVLNGPQALAYCRNRNIGSDFGRTERQRKVLTAVMEKIPKAIVLHPRALVNGIFPNLTTNLSKRDCLLLSLQMGKLITYELEQSCIPITGSFSNANIRGMAVLEVDFEKNKKYLLEKIYGD